MRWALEWRLKELRRRLPPWLQAALKPFLPRGLEHTGPAVAAPADAPPQAATRPPARSSAALVLGYHRIALAEDDPFELGVRPERFAAQLACLRERGRIVPLEEITRCGRGLRFAITFDDGYLDNLTVGLPLLAAESAPATVFVATAFVGGTKEFPADVVRQLVLDPPLDPAVRLTVAGAAVPAALPVERYVQICDLLRPLPEAALAAEIVSLATQVDRRPEVREAYRAMTEDELRQLAASELITIGAHTVDHPSLPAHPEAEQRRQLEESRAWLEARVGAPVDTLAYPYGHYDETTLRVARRAGFRLACTVMPGRVSSLLSARLQLPRILVRDWEPDELLRRLAPWSDGR